MKHFRPIVKFVAIIAIFLLFTEEAKATHAMGADLTYECIGTNQYRVRLSFYRDCAGISPGTNYTLNCNSASCGRSLNVTLTLLAGYPREVSPVCASQIRNTTCNGGTLPGIQQWIYEGVVTLPLACTDWVFSTAINARNNAINTINSPGTQNIYVEARMNNIAAPCNNSPVFANLPVPYVCLGQPLLYNHGATDDEGDSLFYELVPCLHLAGTPVTYRAPYTALSPFASSTPIRIDSANGTIYATPSVVQVGVFAVRVNQFRGGVFIGSVLRDIQITVIPCTNTIPALSPYMGVSGGVLANPYQIQVCAGQTVGFFIVGSDLNALDSLSMFTNVTAALPGATYSIRGRNPDTIFISWTPGASDLGFNSFIVNLFDNNCPIYGQTVQAYDIVVTGIRVTTGDTLYRCFNGTTPARITAAGSTTGYTWSVVSGDTASLTCTTCNPINVSPRRTTVYKVVGTTISGCPSSDTVIVIYIDSFSILASSDTIICNGARVSLNTGSSVPGVSYLWTPATGLSSATVPNPIANPIVNTRYIVRGMLNTCVVFDTINLTLNGQQPITTPSINPTTYCNRDTINLVGIVNPTECNSFRVATIPFAPLTTSGTNVSLSDNQYSSSLNIGFSFSFFCNRYSNFFINSNGFISFNTSGPPGPAAQLLPDNSNPNNIIALYWEDLDPTTGAGNINYYTTGVAPNRRLVVNFNNVRHRGNNNTVTAQIILYETTDVIEMHYTSANTDGGNHTMGIENATGTVAFSTTGRNLTSWSITNTAFRFTPARYTYTWTPASGLIGRTDTSFTRHVVNGPRTYNLSVNNAGCIEDATFIIAPGTTSGSINYTTCFNQPFTFNGISRSVTGTYLDTLLSFRGCDSFLTLNLIVYPSVATSFSATICSNQVYNYNGVDRNTSGAYLDTFYAVNGCDSVVTLNLLVNPVATRTINAAICSNQFYLFNGINRNTTGTYLDTFAAANGCDSVVTLNLTVNPTRTTTINATICSNQVYSFNGVSRNTSGTYLDTLTTFLGCDSTVTLNLTVNPTSVRTINATICSNQVYNFNGVNRNTAGTYLDTFVNSRGCDSVVTLNLTVNATATGTINATICSNQVYNFNGINRNASGTYLDTFAAANACDSVVTLNLIVNPTRTGAINASICSNQVYNFNGVNRNTSGAYLDTLTTFLGCDSVITLNLVVNPTRTTTINATICSNQVYNFNGVSRNTSGTYLDTLTTFLGCDSTVTLNLTVNPTSVRTINASICSNQVYNFNGVNRNTAGTYLDTFVNSRGCDSVVTLNLTINATATGTINATICSNQVYNFNGINRNATGSYLDTFAAANACDSVVTLNLTVNPTRTGAINATICSNQVYNFNGVNRNTSGAYLDTLTTFLGCDSVITLNLVVNPTRTSTINATICSNQVYNFNGVSRNTSGTYLDTLITFLGCDSTVTLNLTVNPTSARTINASICSNQVYNFNGVNRNTAGTYIDTFVNSRGCDSVVTLNLTINATATGTINATICSNQVYNFNGINRNTSGSYLDTFAAANACDSVVTLNLIVNPTRTGAINASICSNQVYNFNGVNRNTSGTYLDTLTSFLGCDSVITLNLVVNPTRTSTINATICSNQVYNFNGVSRNTSGAYLDTLTSFLGCDSTVTLNLTVNPTSVRTINASICSNEVYNFNGVNRNTAGTYIDTFVSSIGCDSVVMLNLTITPTSVAAISATICSNQTYFFNGINRASASTYRDTFTNYLGCDSVLILTLIVNPINIVNISASICSNEVYMYNGINRNVSGTYRDTLINAAGCDSIVILTLTVVPIATRLVSASICDGQSYVFNGVALTTSGSYADTFINFRGCDSIVTLNLTLNPTSARTINASICSNQVYNFNGVNRNTAGTYLDTFVNSRGCDSLVTLNLIVNPTRTGIINATICSNQVYNFNGINRNTSGSYTDTMIASNGCDSVVTLNLIVNPTRTGVINAIICSNQVYNFNGVNRNTSGAYLDTLTTFLGCDSVITLNLVVNPTRTSTINATICSNQVYSFNGVNRNTSGTYLDTLTTFLGCDSIVTLNLTVNPTSARTINASICSNQVYNFNGVNRNTAGTYLDTFVNSRGCDSVVTLNLIVNPTRTGTINATICSNQVYNFNGINRNTSGSYTDTMIASNGCDSIVTLNLTVNPISSGSFTINICTGQSYTFNGVSRTTSGTYRDTLSNITSCDSFVTLTLNVSSVIVATQTLSICSPGSITVGSRTYSVSGVYNDTTTNSVGCDSVIVSTIIIIPTSTGTINATICSNQVYNFNGVSRNTSGSYRDTLVNSRGCDSVITLNLTVNPTSARTINASICSNQVYNFNGVNRNTSGTYLDTFVNSRGCDSVVTLNLIVIPTRIGTINATICSNQVYNFNGINRNTSGSYTDTMIASNGCDSVVTLNLIVNPTRTGVINAIICSNQVYNFNGVNRNTSGAYLDTLTTFLGCDSVITLNLVVNPTRTSTINATICSNQVYSFNGVNRNTSGTYLDTLTTFLGCDSTVTLNLTVNPTSARTINANICSNQVYNFNGVNRNTAGTYLDTFVNSRGCDSVVTLNLIVNPTRTGTINAMICSNQVYNFNGINRNTSGSYTDTMIASNGCDSVVTLNLTVNPISSGSFTINICTGQSYVFNGVSRTTSGTYRDTLSNITGCDSFVTLTLNVSSVIVATQTLSICSPGSIAVGSRTYSVSGVYNDTTTNSVGCDSVIVSTIVIIPTSIGTINATICSNQVYNFNGVSRNTSGSYRDTLVNSRGCDSVITLNLTVNPTSARTINASICSNQVYNFNGVNRNTSGTYLDTFVNSRGCDSVVTLNLTVNPTRTGIINATICSNQVYNFNGINRNTSGSYTDTMISSNGCDSIVTLNLTVNPISSGSFTINICTGQSYTFNGVSRTSSGTYRDTLSNINGCDSFVTLTLNVSTIIVATQTLSICSPGSITVGSSTYSVSGVYNDTTTNSVGCDSVIVSTIVIIPTSAGTINATICSNQVYNFNGVSRNTSGSYRDTLVNSRGCDSVVTLNLTVNPTSVRTINASICSNQVYNFNGVNRNTSGTYLDTFVNSRGCDSVVTLNLIVNPTGTGTINATICSNQVYNFNGINRNTSGSYTDTMIASNGCDSIVTLNLTVNPISSGSFTINICTGQSYTFNGVSRTTSGTYLDTLSNINGCDSFVTLTLNVSTIIVASQTLSICSPGSITVGSRTYSVSGVYNDTTINSVGCDSVIVSTIVIIPTSAGTINATICSNQVYNFNGVSRNTSGSYRDTLVNSRGCDSIVTLNLTVNPINSGIINAVICASQVYNFNGLNINVTGTYTDTLTNVNGCDSLLTLNLTVNPSLYGTINATICSSQFYNFNGVSRNTAGAYLDTFSSTSGCDSIVTLNLTVNPISSGSFTINICTGQSYTFNGVSRTASGTFIDTLSNINGCDSFVTLTLNVSTIIVASQTLSICSPGSITVGSRTYSVSGVYNDTTTNSVGCDSVIVSTIVIMPTSTGTINATICSNQVYNFNGVNRNIAGVYRDTLINSSGCDSVVILNLSVNTTSVGSINASICSGSFYTFNGVNISSDGSYLDTLMNSRGCDSFLTLNLIVNPVTTGTINATICSNRVYNFNGVNRNTSGVYLDTLVNSRGCDSVVTLNLTVNPISAGSFTINICTGQTYLFNGIIRSTTGTYRDTITNASGCDSLLVLNLNVSTVIIASQTLSTCSPGSIRVGSRTYTVSGVYNDTTVNAVGCDSVTITTVVIIPTTTGTINATICSNQVYNFNGVNRNVAGVYRDTLTNSRGCDSIVTLNLLVNPISARTINATICSNQFYLFNGINRNIAGSYLDTFVSFRGCDSVVTLNLNVNPTSTGLINATICSNRVYNFNGVARNISGTYLDTLTNRVGCDSVVTLSLTVNPTTSGSFTINICTGQTYSFNGITRNVSGIYRDTINNIYGCDSFLTLNLNVTTIITASQSFTVCDPALVRVGTRTYTSSGVYYDTSRNVAGCDSLTITTINVLPTISVSLQPTICANESFVVGTHTYNTAGIYFDTLTSVNGCDSLIRTSLNVLPTSAVTVNATICSNETYVIGTSVYNASGTYIDSLTSINGCDSTITLNLIVLPIATFTQRIDICTDGFFFAGGAMRNTTGTYFDTLVAINGCDSVLRTNLMVHNLMYTALNVVLCSGESFTVGARTYTSSGIYRDTLNTIWGCDSIVTTNIIVNPVSYSTIDTIMCFGDILRIGTSSYSVSGTYYDTLANMFGCDSTIRSIVKILPVNFRTIDTTICEGHYYDGVRYYASASYNDTLHYLITNCDSFITIHNINVILNDSIQFSGDSILCYGDSAYITAVGGDNLNYYWWPDIEISCTNCASPLITATTSRTYYCMSFGPCGDTLISSVNVVVNALPLVTAYGDTSIIYTYGAQIYSEGSGVGPLTYSWYNMTGLECNNCQSTIVFPDRSQPYTVFLQDGNGCVARDSIYIIVKYDCSDSLIEVPNMMTPNGDGANDEFRFINPENIPISSTRIFNRWGEMMYESFSPNAKWDATYQGSPVNPGVYVYVIEGGCPFGQFKRSGNISVIK